MEKGGGKDGIVRVITAWEIEVEESKKSSKTNQNQLSAVNEMNSISRANSSALMRPGQINLQTIERSSPGNTGSSPLTILTPIRNRVAGVQTSPFMVSRTRAQETASANLVSQPVRVQTQVSNTSQIADVPPPLDLVLQHPTRTLTASDQAILDRRDTANLIKKSHEKGRPSSNSRPDCL